MALKFAAWFLIFTSVLAAAKAVRLIKSSEVLNKCNPVLYTVVYKPTVLGPSFKCVSNVQKHGPVFSPTPVED
jgi:hypothetical protein